MDDITDVDYTHAQRACNGFEIKNVSEYHDLYLKSNTLLFTDDSENFRKICLEI